MGTRVEIAESPALEVCLISGQGELVPLEAAACIHVFALQSQVGIRVGQRPFIVFLGAYCFVFLRHKDVGLNAAAEGGALLLLFLSRQRHSPQHTGAGRQ